MIDLSGSGAYCRRKSRFSRTCLVFRKHPIEQTSAYLTCENESCQPSFHDPHLCVSRFSGPGSALRQTIDETRAQVEEKLNACVRKVRLMGKGGAARSKNVFRGSFPRLARLRKLSLTFRARRVQRLDTAFYEQDGPTYACFCEGQALAQLIHAKGSKMVPAR